MFDVPIHLSENTLLDKDKYKVPLGNKEFNVMLMCGIWTAINASGIATIHSKIRVLENMHKQELLNKCNCLLLLSQK